MVVYGCINSLYQDIIGKQAYIEKVQNNWIDGSVTIPLAVGLLVLVAIDIAYKAMAKPELEPKKWKPKKGAWILVWDDNRSRSCLTRFSSVINGHVHTNGGNLWDHCAACDGFDDLDLTPDQLKARDNRWM